MNDVGVKHVYGLRLLVKYRILVVRQRQDMSPGNQWFKNGAMTQKELLLFITARLGWEETNVIGALEAFIDIVRQEVVAGNRVDIGEFGLFQALRHPEYILIEAEAGERYLMPPSVEVVFEAAIMASNPETVEVGNALHFIPDCAAGSEAG